jgi:predicted CXXCH cytochrome family protein
VTYSFKICIAAFIALIALGMANKLFATGKAAIHPLEKGCSTCHMAGNSTTSKSASILKGNQEQLCGGCHETALKMSHPSGFTPKPGTIIPAEYPLDWKGELTCSTCHMVHSDMPGKLRGTLQGRDFCLACHDSNFFKKMIDGGESMILSGHLGLPTTNTWKSLDPYSVQCMECHGERGDVVVDGNNNSGSIFIVRHANKNHPVGVSYAEAANYGGYVPIFKLSKKIQLPNGVISCISCHEGFTKNHGQLVSTIEYSKLCYECHDL